MIDAEYEFAINKKNIDATDEVDLPNIDETIEETTGIDLTNVDEALENTSYVQKIDKTPEEDVQAEETK